ncbi:MAG TPA: signal recognition particle protein [Solirubrobacterales bacterium]|jgi:signal recognition particle subunit SRP54|nr:signal recognition particle protein [Solirubrobacterales bacterium]
MFDQLSDRLQATLSDVRNRGKLTEADVDAAMRDIRLALLEADVNFKVVKAFTKTLKERCLDAEVLNSLDPGQHVVKIVNEELTDLMGGTGRELAMTQNGPTVILMAGLQGSGKTTACAKLALHFGAAGKDVALAACDVYRPAAIEQLVTVGKRANAAVYEQGTEADPVEIASWALERAKAEQRDILIVDTAGRLHIDTELMDELAKIRKRTRPHNVLLVVDAMTGQDAVGVAESFAEAAEFDGVVMTKLDGDARGGAALSVKAVTGKPILFASTGEKLEDFDRFHPDRMASRILGMGDVLSLIEKAEQQVDANQAADLEAKLKKDQFTLEDFLQQMRQVRKMGPLSGLIGMIPGMGAMKQLKNANIDESELDRVEAIILSMTPAERANPAMINGSRRKRIANGSGTRVQNVKQLIKQFDQMRKMMRQMVGGKMPNPQQLAQMSGAAAPRPKMRRR